MIRSGLTENIYILDCVICVYINDANELLYSAKLDDTRPALFIVPALRACPWRSLQCTLRQSACHSSELWRPISTHETVDCVF